MSFKTPMGRVIGLGSAKHGTEHFWSQRVTSVALIPLGILALFPLAGALGSDYSEVLDTYQNPWTTIFTILFIAVAFNHLRLGLQVVIEDYVHNKGMRTALLLSNTMLCALFGATGVFAVAKIAFGV
jgi:succinate dehydrogenase / fumarate reductase membrane anchor subunit